MKTTLLRLSVLFLMLVSVSLSPSVYASQEGDDLRAVDAALNRSYQKALAAMPDAATKTKLRDAQRAWVAFRDAEIALNGSLPGAGGGILKMLQTDLTQIRTKQLDELVEAAR